MKKSQARVGVSMFLGGVTGLMIGFIYQMAPLGLLVGMILGCVYGVFFDKPNSDK